METVGNMVQLASFIPCHVHGDETANSFLLGRGGILLANSVVSPFCNNHAGKVRYIPRV